MPVMTSYPHGVPSWVDLATPDPEGAKAFYGELFGWTFEHSPTDQPGVDYVMANKGEHSAAGMMQLSPEMAASGMPPVWTTYINVDDIESAVAAVEPNGGAVLQPSMDVMEAGRMAVLRDPSGGVVALWEARQHIGCEVVNEHGALTWNELTTPDPAAVADFYGAVVGWTSETAPMPTGDYTVFHAEGGNPDGIAGAMAPPMPGIPTFWAVYFQVDDVAATVDRAKALGAQVLAEPMDIEGVGTFATLTDPQGAVVAVMAPES